MSSNVYVGGGARVHIVKVRSRGERVYGWTWCGLTVYMPAVRVDEHATCATCLLAEAA